MTAAADGPYPHLRDLVAVMDRLRSPGGCPWDAEQTAESLVAYAVEEVYEVAEAVETGDRGHLREELGDLLLQVVFQARVAQEHATEPFDIEDVAAGIAAKLRRRHPHVFGPDADAGLDPAEVHRRWEQIKAAEKTERTSVLDGIPAGMPGLARAQKVVARARRAGLDGVPAVPDAADPAARLGAQLLDLVRSAAGAGIDAEAALRAAVRDLEARVRAAEPSGAEASG
ncbi:MazG family protein [Isoptericola sp. b490]|uniref:MazG family protein n=1 Tax=Actinotalea lenta TaxID=3064654 RepID=UPI0027133F94|nr:MazG family protein [Isoptericola sp. b490]MDO8121472.1 MazG family protein [Isoptericola sp. b490]